MNALETTRNPFKLIWNGWNQFWFKPSDPATLSAIRLFAGAMLFYTHLVWSKGLSDFFGQEGFLPMTLRAEMLAERPFIWTWFKWIDSPGLLWTVHVFCLIIFFMLMIGLFSRIVAPLAFVAAVAYVHRIAPGAFFGLDKINCLLALYLIFGPCGARYSVDSFLRRRKEREAPGLSSSATTAIRLIQIHMCIIYLFGGLAKLQGGSWWNGSATWWSVASVEYQSLDMSWLANWPGLFIAMTFGTVLWELFYIALIWNRYTRKLCLFIAILVHGGIAVALGMITFGLAMLIGNLAFVEPATVRKLLEWKRPKLPARKKKERPATVAADGN